MNRSQATFNSDEFVVTVLASKIQLGPLSLQDLGPLKFVQQKGGHSNFVQVGGPSNLYY